MTTDEFPKDPEYWQNLEALGTPALMPNDEEVKLFQKYCASGSVLLLGETKQLIHLADRALDAHPCGKYDISVQGSWMEVDGYWDTIIGDGCLNLCDYKLVEALRPCCNQLVVRVFEQWLYEWRYATCFPTEFPGASEKICTQPGCNLLVWDFKR